MTQTRSNRPCACGHPYADHLEDEACCDVCIGFRPTTAEHFAHLPGYSALDHLADDIIGRAERALAEQPLGSGHARYQQALQQALDEMTDLMGPRAWPRIEIGGAA